MGPRVRRQTTARRTMRGVEPMGRGRAKAKQTKVARDLKYRDQPTDFGKLADELHHGGGGLVFPDDRVVPGDYDPWTDEDDPRERSDRSA